MATLPLSLAIRPCCGAIQSSKLTAAPHYICKSKLTQVPGRIIVERKLLCGEASKNVVKTNRDINLRVFAASRVSVDQTEQIFTTSTEVDELKKMSTYLFRTELGGLVNVFIRKADVKYEVKIEVISLQLSSGDNRLVLIWGVYRSDSSNFISLESQQPVPDAKTKMIETPFMQNSLGRFVVELEFEAKQTPFYLSFLLKSPLGSDSSDLEIRSHLKASFCVPVGFNAGSPAPLGPSFPTDDTINFAIFSRNAESVVLCLYDDIKAEEPALELDLDPYVNRSGDVWHASMESSWNFVSYCYRCKWAVSQGNRHKSHAERVLLDPYAKVIQNSIPIHPESGLLSTYLGQPCKEPAFDWDGDVCLNLPMEKLMVYRLNVNRFTKHKSSQLLTEVAGTFSGLTEKVHHLKDLGLNAVLLEPIFPFDEQKGPYFPCHFFSPMPLHGPSGACIAAINSMKEMVKKLHANGIEVLLEVVYTHTADGGALQGIDDLSYYYGKEVEDLKTRNVLKCNHPIVQQLILDSLRYWVTEFHIDGFCFINASSLLRGFHGEYLSRPPLVEAIAFDPLLSKVKIIADCSGPHDVVPKEIHFPHWKRWAEVNTRFCNDVRNFLRGEGLLSYLATRLCGSGDVFSDGRGPAYSFNFIARNSGLPLVDLVSFSSDQLATELSWNCGEEGPTKRSAVLERRLKQIRNFLFVLYLSLGVPILNMGDECGQSSGGSPSYADRKLFNWNTMATGFGIQTKQFISFLSSFRLKRSDLLQQRNFLKEENIDWYGSDLSPPRWEDASYKFLAVRLKTDKSESQLNSESSHIKGDVYMAFNASSRSENVSLPPPAEGMTWHRLVDTALQFPGFFSIDGEPVLEQEVGLHIYEMKPYSCTLFEACCSSN
ncbi:isoamylase 2, chloroplastic isoform X1 [Pistacia vera]|uniref:isoamylase 2, chloroplastic isoform X1 n=1 Tax=Pistacia vera TaxID=55513 RepID=UPI001263C957|nr:isoamylase 2, chloroplastic isoform X1 [Pistacia vera]XP_031279993.1 isoamylase 2, chloroplastic isoform X1 [Pistacia vera]XP_031279994.1 isoamylase 2, chloroplastic isoform X1 [Pistacia vera]